MALLEAIHDLLVTLFPLNRSLTGDGNRKTLDILGSRVALEIHEVRSGTDVFDWTVPLEWWINDAYVLNAAGKKILDWKSCNLHVVNYSAPIDARLTLEELLPKLHSLPCKPDAIPYRTTYYKRDWGFCIAESLKSSPDFVGPFTVKIDSGFCEDGSLTYAQALHPGRVKDEILIATYCCHPSLANDNLSGLITAVLLFEEICSHNTHYSYRLLIAPETIGAITFLATQPEAVMNIVASCVVTTTAGKGPLGLKHSFEPAHQIDELAVIALNNAPTTSTGWKEYPFVPNGSDERQFSSPGFRIPTITICKDKYYEYEEYHTSDDNLDFVTPEQLLETLEVYKHWIRLLENNRTYRRKQPYCEYRLGKRGLFPALGGSINQPTAIENANGYAQRSYQLETANITGAHLDAFKWIMFACDGKTDVLSICKMSGLDINIVIESCQLLLKETLLEIVQ